MKLNEEETVSPGRAAPGEWREGWRIVAAGFAGCGVGFPMFMMTAGLFIIPLQQELGLSRSAVMIGPVVALAAAFLTPIAGVYVDRYGARQATIAGLVALTISYLLLALVPATPVSYYSIAVLIALAGTVSSPMIYCKGVATWFVRNAGIAFGLMLSGTSVAAALAAPLLSSIIQDHGWRFGYGACAVVVALVGLPPVIAWFHQREQVRPSPVAVAGPSGGAAAKEAIRSPQFWLLMAAFGCATLPIGGILSQLYPLLVNEGFSPAAAAATMSVYAISVGIGRIGMGILLDRFHSSRVASGSLFLSGAGTALLLLTLLGWTPWFFVILAAFLLGWGQGAEADFLAFFTQRVFGISAFAAIFSWFNLVAGGGLAVGGLLFAASFDLFGHYQHAIAASVALWLASALLMLMIRSGNGSVVAHQADRGVSRDR